MAEAIMDLWPLVAAILVQTMAAGIWAGKMMQKVDSLCKQLEKLNGRVGDVENKVQNIEINEAIRARRVENKLEEVANV